MKQDHFSQFEDRIQHLIEGGFARLFSGRLHPHELAVQLAKAMEDGAVHGLDGQLIVPDTYCIRLNVHDHEAILNEHPRIAITLANELLEMARISKMALAASPQVKILADATIESHRVSIDAWHTDNMDATQSMKSGYEELTIFSSSAILVLNGTQHIPINRPVLNLGRHHDNHIIISDPMVSRHHAQIRLRFRRHVLFDLGSISGTTVNGCQIRETILTSGDIIAIGHSKLIYIEDDDFGMSTKQLPSTQK